mmetsp:Transcript_15221/g.12508  ORF Transcript_15221/g.12508 Transcript_15221/m.12508 type:complete len:104 (+) Transcript_15221:430-741(+)
MDSEDAQKKIYQDIQQSRKDDNLKYAQENMPDVFEHINMLYFDAKIKNDTTQVFVDTGAQMTVMDVKIAETLGLSSLIDERFAGIAKGVGESKILGRILRAPM